MGVVVLLMFTIAVAALVLWWTNGWHGRGGPVSWDDRTPPERGTVSGAHDSGVWVDEAAWAEIVRRLKRS